MRRTVIPTLLWVLGLAVCSSPASGAEADTHPTASFQVSQPRLSGVPITFDASGSTFPDGQITQYSWDFDPDGNVDVTGTEPTVQWTFARGTYVVGLEVTGQDANGDSRSARAWKTIEVTNSAPFADFTVQPVSPLTGEAVVFRSNSTDPDGIPDENQSWDLDADGAFDDGSGAAASTAFRQPGAHLVRLRVEDRFGAVAVREQVVAVGNRAPTADFRVVPAAPRTEQLVNFVSTASDSDGVVARIAWDLNGDGAFDDASGRTAFATFSTSGGHVVRSEAVDWDGAVSIAEQTVWVQEPPAAEPSEQPTDAGPRFLDPVPTVRISGRATSRGAQITLLTVVVPTSSWVDARCRGRGCPVRHVRRRTAGNGRTVLVRLRPFEHWLPVGTRLVIRIGKDGYVGRYVKFLIRAARAPRRTNRCLAPGGLAPVRCSAFHRRPQASPSRTPTEAP
jgi:PKD repeat protein